MSDLDNKLLEVVTKFDVLATKYTPEALEMAVYVTRVDAIGDIIGVVLFSSLVLFLVFKFKGKIINLLDEGDQPEVLIAIYSSLVLGVSLVMSAIVLVCTLLNHWVWIAIFDPKLALAHKIIQSI